MKSFNENGFYLLENCFTQDELNEVLSSVHQLFIQQMHLVNFQYQQTENGFLKASSLFKFYSEYQENYIASLRAAQRLISVYKIAIHQKLISTLSKLGLKNPNFNVRPILTMKSKYTSKSFANWKIPPHQDYRSMQGSLNSIVVWIPIIDVASENGAVEVIVGSHKNGLLPTVEDEWYRHIEEKDLKGDFVSVPMKAGSALFFSSFLVHKSGENISDEFRYSLEVRFDDFSEESYVKEKYITSYSTPMATQELINKSIYK